MPEIDASGAQGETPSPAPLELLHPTGRPSAVVRAGEAEVGGFGSDGVGVSGGELDVLLLAPTPDERRSREWAERAARLAASVAPDGLVVVVGGARRLRLGLRRLGLRPEVELLHVPNVAVSRYILPRGGPAGRYAISKLLPLSPAKRLAGRALAATSAGSRGRTSTVFRRPGAEPMLAWLNAAVQSHAGGSQLSAVISRSWRRGGSTVIHSFSAGVPDAVVKLGAAAPSEVRALARVAAGARGEGVAVPAVVREGALGDVPLLVETPIAGSLAWSELRGDATGAARLLDLVARWLAGWNAATAVARPFGPAEAEHWLLARARSLAPLWPGGREYVSRLERLCRSCEGVALPMVAAHNDLTAANIVLAGGGAIGVVDWERAETAAPPLGDLAYAAVDFNAAVKGYRDRPAAYAACFLDAGRERERTARLIGESASALGIGDPLAELCVHACWLRHAANERDQLDGEPDAERPFLEILKLAASEAE